MIAFKDFVPHAKGREAESVEAVLDRVNGWVHERGVRVINLETLLLPNVEKTGEAELRTEGGSDYWYQVVRLWFEE